LTLSHSAPYHDLPGTTRASSFFCQDAIMTAEDRIDMPSPADLRQETILRLLQIHQPAPTCEALITADPGLARRIYATSRAEFFRARYGRQRHSHRLVPLSIPAIAAMLLEPEAEHGLPLILESRLLDQSRTLGETMIHEVVTTMRAAQRAKRHGRISNPLRQKLYRLRLRTGLPLQTELL